MSYINFQEEIEDTHKEPQEKKVGCRLNMDRISCNREQFRSDRIERVQRMRHAQSKDVVSFLFHKYLQF